MAGVKEYSGADLNTISRFNGVSNVLGKINGVDVSPASFLLDTYTGAAAAYSVRRLNSLYTGACMRVREDGTNTETDIGFDANGDLDTAAIASHCGANNGYIRKWYDQSQSGGTGSGNDAEQATASAQPQIYNGTAVLTNANGNVAMRFLRTSSTSLDTPDFDMYDNGWFCVTVAERKGTSGDQRYIDAFGGLGDRTGEIFRHDASGLKTTQTASTGGTGASVTGSISSNVSYLWTSENTSTNLSLYINGSSQGSSAITSQLDAAKGFDIGRRKGLTEGYSDTLSSEIIYWASNQSSNRTGIEGNINTYFSIY